MSPNLRMWVLLSKNYHELQETYLEMPTNCNTERHISMCDLDTHNSILRDPRRYVDNMLHLASTLALDESDHGWLRGPATFCRTTDVSYANVRDQTD